MEVNIGKIRTQKGISTRNLERLSGIPRSRLSDIENQTSGKSPPNLGELEKIAKALGVRIVELFESEYK